MRSRYLQLALLASRAALRHSDEKGFLVGAAAIRNDGTLVSAGNGPSIGVTPRAHAESRLCRKLDCGATVLVIRVRRDGTLGCALPCRDCVRTLESNMVRRVFYSNAVGEICRLW
jgi:hypothetical protein